VRGARWTGRFPQPVWMLYNSDRYCSGFHTVAKSLYRPAPNFIIANRTTITNAAHEGCPAFLVATEAYLFKSVSEREIFRTEAAQRYDTHAA